MQRVGTDATKRAISILERLVSFPTISADGNSDLIAYIACLLEEAGISFTRLEAPGKDRASLLARVGPPMAGGVILSGHTDVVPVQGQPWSSDPFRLTKRGERLLGRGAADMKGFVACAIDALFEAASKPLGRPLYLALSYDEEIGCVGVRPMLDHLVALGVMPDWVLVGEPTEMRIAVGHKGKVAARACCWGVAAHSALAPKGLNAIHLAADFLSELRTLQSDLAVGGAQDAGYDIPYSTVHAGMISGGTALNIVPDNCFLDFEIRNVAEDDPKLLLDRLSLQANLLSRKAQAHFKSAGISIDIINAYPGLSGKSSSPLDRLHRQRFPSEPMKVAFGTEGGLYSAALSAPVFICGPGSMDQGHKADEFVTMAQMEECRRMLSAVVDSLLL